SCPSCDQPCYGIPSNGKTVLTRAFGTTVKPKESCVALRLPRIVIAFRRHVVTTTRTRSRGRRDSRSSAAREGAERRPAVLASAGVVIVVLAFGLAVTSTGRVILAASDHFLLKYGGVFALLAL